MRSTARRFEVARFGEELFRWVKAIRVAVCCVERGEWLVKGYRDSSVNEFGGSLEIFD